MKKFFILALPLSFSLLSAAEYAETEEIAARGFEGGRDTLNRNFDDYRNYKQDEAWNAGYYGGYGGYGGGYGIYGPTLLPSSAIAPNDDIDQIYQNNLNNMERTGK
jgi:hypothetical protein